jgi:lipopolysaccharide biosynthesis protein
LDDEHGKPDTVLTFHAPEKVIPGVEYEKIAIHVHLYYADMAGKIAGYLKNVRHPYALLVSVNDSDAHGDWQKYFLENLPFASSVTVKALPNRGRDVAPWVIAFRDQIKASTIFCHFHTKRSPHNIHLADWFSYLAHSMLGSTGIVDGILEVFCTDPNVGLVTQCYPGILMNRQPNYGLNREVLQRLLNRMGAGKLPELCPDYPAGSFFWVRSRILNPLFDLKLDWNDFDDEKGQVDGTLAHGIERLMGLLPGMTGTRRHMVTVDVAYDKIEEIARYRIHPSG